MLLFSPATACSVGGVLAFIAPRVVCRPTTVVGAAIFVFGTLHQTKCHRILAELKASMQPARGTTRRRYGIPRGDWFEYCSSAHYLVRLCSRQKTSCWCRHFLRLTRRLVKAEIVIYTGLVVICSGSTTAVRPPANVHIALHRSHERAASVQMLLLVAVVANLHFAATLTHAWYLEHVPVRHTCAAHPDPHACWR